MQTEMEYRTEPTPPPAGGAALKTTGFDVTASILLARLAVLL